MIISHLLQVTVLEKLNGKEWIILLVWAVFGNSV